MKKYSDSTLMRLTKAELIEQLRCAEYNREVAEEQLARQAENVKDWVPVVRCKDSEYVKVPDTPRFMLKRPDTLKCGCIGAASSKRLVYPNDFCSYGERKKPR